MSAAAQSSSSSSSSSSSAASASASASQQAKHPAGFRLSSNSKRIVSVPSYKSKEIAGEQVTIYDVFVNGKYANSKRYNDFYQLNSSLRSGFPSFNFPKFPMKWPFSLSETQTEERRCQLDEFMRTCCIDNGILDSQMMQEFVLPDPETATSDASAIELIVRLPSRISVPVAVTPETTAAAVYDTVIRRIGLDKSSANYFALFEVVDNFERKFSPDEFPLQILRKRFGDDPKAYGDSIVLRKWIFTKLQEVFVSDDDVAVDMLYFQAKDDIARGLVQLSSLELTKELNEYKINGMRMQYLDVARRLPGYSELNFPPCKCVLNGTTFDDVVFSASAGRLVLKLNGSVLQQLKLRNIQRWKINDKDKAFLVSYDEMKEPIVLFSPFYSFMSETALRIITEYKWSQEANKKKQEVDQSDAQDGGVSAATSSLSAVAIDYASWGVQKASNFVYGTINFFKGTPESLTASSSSASMENRRGEQIEVNMDPIGDDNL